jgi:hypothetical protein
MSKNDFIPDAQTSAYARGFKDGWDAALKSLDKTYVPDTTKPAKTLDICWPDRPPPGGWNRMAVCTVCNMNTSNLTHYVCPQTNCPGRAIWLTYSYGTGV